MNIVVFGAEGQLGVTLKEAFSRHHHVTPLSRQNVDITNAAEVTAALQKLTPDVVLNAAAYTAVDKAEAESANAAAVNAEGVANIANGCKTSGAFLVHYSTDYVFDGEKNGAYLESDQTNPLSVYGKTKLEGEEAVSQSGAAHFTFRTSWVYSAHGSNFPKTILRLAQEREDLAIVADQFGAPTSTALIADVTLQTVEAYFKTPPAEKPGLIGLYHLTAGGETSWYGFARFVLEQAQKEGLTLKCPPSRIAKTTTAEYKTAAQRPLNSRMDTQKIKAAFGITLPDWQQSAGEFVKVYMKQNQQKVA